MKGFYHNGHGLNEHDLAIFLTERLIVNAGHELRDARQYPSKYCYPGKPDVWCIVEEKRHSGPNIIKNKKSVIIEIESNLTRINEEKKNNQFAKPIIINLDDIEGTHDSIKNLEAHIRKNLLFVED